ncbi:MAG TPA: 3,4-dihydroxy-2-butanone-4-phosphate synthase, partial [Thermoplasmatales archaeon]|nr:3,4-dihydroxy-2-butanone-4-phosphate synthase [Thermoplasmatales archaeon]
DIPYDTKSSFSISINHRKTFTGITDKDRGLTIRRFAEISREALTLPNREAVNLLGREFRSPGHVPLCIASRKPLIDRFGHTELTISMLTMANLTPVGVGCEIMGDNGGAMPKWEVKQYAEERGYIFLEGKVIIDRWRSWLK